MEKTILVVGGAGYIGSHQVKMLAKRGYEVVVYDNLSTGYRDLVTVDNFEKGDLADKDRLKEVFSRYDIDAVMHFAAFIQVGESVKNPAKYYKNNVVNVINLLDVMLEYDVKYFIFSSTAAVYGEPEEIPIKEGQAKKPISPYGKSKLMVEQILEDYDRAYNLRYTCFRYFNASGADESGRIGEKHDPETHLIPLVLQTALGERDEIYIFGTDYDTRDNTCIRDFIHVNDLADAHIRGLERLFEGDNSEVFNLGSGDGYSVREIIDKAKEITQVNFKVVEDDRREGDPAVLIADSSKATQMLAWEPKYNLEDIIRTAWNWHKSEKI
ncbi:UDP-glucose 4-epimerase GalE [Acetohalobium arabaticum]|uniref:UDP-glucose 4-epimerase n=1 Tax=Acetohalobium arabaticum (strain ATCC 49924 / DSM 5501 / Z-7288) TaxID=574087 RepID=D9QTS1_ACEAZ|nr:UDP-glucose 4-epimerase GalE [Acetohalobium arabaticum]ADL13642.1 UDP-galactose 4-epimerase [Acetohalobium arabaticum DSM 5501]